MIPPVAALSNYLAGVLAPKKKAVPPIYDEPLDAQPFGDSYIGFDPDKELASIERRLQNEQARYESASGRAGTPPPALIAPTPSPIDAAIASFLSSGSSLPAITTAPWNNAAALQESRAKLANEAARSAFEAQLDAAQRQMVTSQRMIGQLGTRKGIVEKMKSDKAAREYAVDIKTRTDLVRALASSGMNANPYSLGVLIQQLNPDKDPEWVKKAADAAYAQVQANPSIKNQIEAEKLSIQQKKGQSDEIKAARAILANPNVPASVAESAIRTLASLGDPVYSQMTEAGIIAEAMKISELRNELLGKIKAQTGLSHQQALLMQERIKWFPRSEQARVARLEMTRGDKESTQAFSATEKLAEMTRKELNSVRAQRHKTKVDPLADKSLLDSLKEREAALETQLGEYMDELSDIRPAIRLSGQIGPTPAKPSSKTPVKPSSKKKSSDKQRAKAILDSLK